MLVLAVCWVKCNFGRGCRNAAAEKSRDYPHFCKEENGRCKEILLAGTVACPFEPLQRLLREDEHHNITKHAERFTVILVIVVG